MQNVKNAVVLDIGGKSMIQEPTKGIVKIQINGDTDVDIHQVIMD